MPHHLFNPTNNNPSQSGSVGEKTYRPDEAIHTFFADLWIASRSLSSGAHSRDPLARNDDPQEMSGP
jgi:hypothetical protein